VFVVAIRCTRFLVLDGIKAAGIARIEKSAKGRRKIKLSKILKNCPIGLDKSPIIWYNTFIRS